MQTPFNAPGLSGKGRSSSVKALVAGGDVRKNWIAINQLASGLLGQAGGVSSLRGQINTLKPVARFIDTLHPFKIYQLPSVLRVTPDPATDWLKFLVRAGRVLEVDADGTDAIDDDPDSEEYPATPAEITVPVNTEKFWFWLEINTGSAILRYGPDPTASEYEEEWVSSDPWTIAPIPDEHHVPIGWVDTDTQADENTPIIRQLLRTDVVSVGGGAGTGLRLMKVVTIADDYLICCNQVLNEGVLEDGVETYNVAKPAGFRGASVHLVPPYAATNLIGMAAIDHTGVLVGKAELTFIDANIEGRAVGTDFHWYDATDECKQYHAYIVMTAPELVS